jgi:hypothetical protein
MPWRVAELPKGPARVQAGTISQIFPSKSEARQYRTDVLLDPEGDRYEIIETDVSGRMIHQALNEHQGG